MYSVPLPYQERIGHHLARDQETLTGRILDGQCQGGPEGEKLKTTNWEVTKNKKRSLKESCESLIVGYADGGEKRRRRRLCGDTSINYLSNQRKH